MSAQKNISDYLRMADKEIKNAQLEKAMGFINRIFALEQKNVYAKAYKERIISLMEAQGMSRADAEHKAAAATYVDEPAAEVKPVPPAAPAAEPPPAAVKERPVTAAPPRPAPATFPPPPPKRPDPIIAPIPIPDIDEIKKQIVPNTPATTIAGGVHQIRRSAAASEAYRTLLLEIWKDGAISADEQTRIDSMRETFAISPDEHVKIEKEVRLTSYLNAIREEWRKGVTDFEPLRKKFRITDSEQIAIEPKVFQLLQSLQSNGSVLVLDDDEAFLKIIKGILSEGGYYCFTSITGEEGLQLLETMTPDIVVCDINFTKPNMSGFAFYEKFRSMDKFLHTPFIFLSALDQDVLVRTGKKLGADDYLFKPVDTEMFLATIEGKLRRSRELKRAM